MSSMAALKCDLTRRNEPKALKNEIAKAHIKLIKTKH